MVSETARVETGVWTHFVVKLLLLLKLLEARREELEVVGGDLARPPRSTRDTGASRAALELSAVVLVDRVVGRRLALALRRLDPEQAGLARLATAVLLALPLRRRRLRARVEDLELVKAELRELRVELGRLLLAAADDLVNVVRDGHRLGRVDDLVGTVLDHVDEFILVGGLAADLRAALLDDELVEAELLRGTLEHLLFDGVLRDEAEDVDLLGLADTVGAVHRLQVGLRVPADDDAVSDILQ